MEDNNEKPIRTKDESHLIPEWQKTPEYLDFLEAKKVHDEAVGCNCTSEAKLEELENDLRQKHLALIHARFNQFANVDFSTRANGKGFFIS